MHVTECTKIDLTQYKLPAKDNIYLIRIEPEDLSVALQDVLKELCDFSWLNKFDQEYLRVSREVNAKKTCDALKEKFTHQEGEAIVCDAGEYIVSVFSKRGIVETLGHNDVPLAELLGRKKTGNPGFDFFTEEPNLQLITCGEAKYVHGKNAYGTSLKQINEFIKDKKQESDILILDGLVAVESLQNIVQGKFGICAAFSTTKTPTQTLVSNICLNNDFGIILNYDYIVLVAVDFV